jgi:hypothetical protein
VTQVMGNCIPTSSAVEDTSADYPAVLHCGAERQMRETNRKLLAIYFWLMSSARSKQKGADKHRQGVHHRPPLVSHQGCGSHRSCCSVLETLASRPSSTCVPYPHTSLAFRRATAQTWPNLSRGDAMTPPFLVLDSKCGSSTPSLGPRPRSRSAVNVEQLHQ